MPALLEPGAIGTVQNVHRPQECFGFMLHNLQGNSCLNPELGGGVLFDARWADSGIGILCSATLHCADGCTALLIVRWTPLIIGVRSSRGRQSRRNRVAESHQRRSADRAARAARPTPSLCCPSLRRWLPTAISP